MSHEEENLFDFLTKIKCKNTFTFKNEKVCSNCNKYLNKYNFAKRNIKTNYYIDYFEVEYPFENNQEHQEQSEARFLYTVRQLENCLFSSDLLFWESKSETIANYIYRYRRMCEEKILIKLLKKELRHVPIEFFKLNYFNEKLKVIKTNRGYELQDKNDDFKTESFKQLNEFYLLSKIYRCFFLIDDDKISYDSINLYELLFLLSIFYYYGEEAACFYFFT